MKRLWIFTLGLVAALIVFGVLVAWYTLVFQAGNISMSNMMGQMMGNQYSNVSNPMPAYFWVSIIAVIAALVVGTGGVVFYVAYPEIRRGAAQSVISSSQLQQDSSASKIAAQSDATTNNNIKPAAPASGGNWSMLMRTSKPDEKRVLDVLHSHNGVYLQKLIVKEAELSKLKTHRIISRFTERGIVTVSKSGNTNEVRLSPWLFENNQTRDNTKSK